MAGSSRRSSEREEVDRLPAPVLTDEGVGEAADPVGVVGAQAQEIAGRRSAAAQSPAPSRRRGGPARVRAGETTRRALRQVAGRVDATGRVSARGGDQHRLEQGRPGSPGRANRASAAWSRPRRPAAWRFSLPEALGGLPVGIGQGRLEAARSSTGGRGGGAGRAAAPRRRGRGGRAGSAGAPSVASEARGRAGPVAGGAGRPRPPRSRRRAQAREHEAATGSRRRGSGRDAVWRARAGRAFAKTTPQRGQAGVVLAVAAAGAVHGSWPRGGPAILTV